MRVLVVSDSHGDVGRLEDILFACSQRGSLDRIIHLGDGARDMDRVADMVSAEFPRATVHLLKGNNDFAATHLPAELTLPLGSQSIFATHGHLFGVKRGLQRLDEVSAKSGCQVTLFGHTHVPAMFMKCTLLLNPGSVMDGCYLLLSLDEKRQVKPQLM